MIWRDIIYLVTVTYTPNDIGDIVETKTQKQVFANKTSIKRSEFYQAHAVGLQPEVAFEIRSIDYSDEKKLRYNGNEYNDRRSYTKYDDIVELVCNRLVGG